MEQGGIEGPFDCLTLKKGFSLSFPSAKAAILASRFLNGKKVKEAVIKYKSMDLEPLYSTTQQQIASVSHTLIFSLTDICSCHLSTLQAV